MSNPREYPKFEVFVDEEAIQSGVCGIPTRCIGAYAVRKCYPNARNVWVDSKTTRFRMDGHRYVFDTPTKMVRVIQQLDSITAGDAPKGAVAPFAFTLDKPIEVFQVLSKVPHGPSDSSLRRIPIEKRSRSRFPVEAGRGFQIAKKEEV